MTSALSDSDKLALLKILADEINVKRVIVNGKIVYEEPLLKDKYKEKQEQFERIYNGKI